MADDRDKEKDLKSQLSEAIKKIALMGVGTVFLTEETVRSFFSDFKLPKEIMNGFLENAAKTKADFFATFAKEAASTLAKIDVVKESTKFLETHHVKLSIEVDFVPKKKSDLEPKA